MQDSLKSWEIEQMTGNALTNNLIPLTTPVLFLVFNRPEITKEVFEAIRQARPPKLYVASDGPRLKKEGETATVQEVRRIATGVDWDCEVITLFRDQNLGCKMAVSNAITWFFEHEEEGIILEDDCLPDQSFFPYCQELLDKYRYDTRIMAITGDNFQQGEKHTEYSYYFSRYNHIWGWASWRRAWRYYDRDLLTWPIVKEKGCLNDIGEGDEGFVSYWEKIFDKCHAGQIDTWDYQWCYSCWMQSGLAVFPNVNLVGNIGFGEEATHTQQTVSTSEIPIQKMEFPLRHPNFVLRNRAADQFIEEKYFSSGCHKQSGLFYRLFSIFSNSVRR